MILFPLPRRDLIPYCPYELAMRAKNSIGTSEPSQVTTFRTGEEMPGGPPLDVSVEPLSSSSLKIKWRPPERPLQYGQIKGYYIGYRLVDGAGGGGGGGRDGAEEQFAYKNVEASGVAESQATEVAYLTNLKKHTVYSIVVQAFNSIGAGPRSDEINVKTLNQQQATTLVLEVVTTDSSSISLHWEVDSGNGGSSDSDHTEPTGDFTLHISEEGSGHWIERRLPSTLRRHVESGLKCGTKYLIYMTHKDKSTTGEMITARTKGTVAISPSADDFIFSNSTTIALNFNAWHNGGCPIREYSVKYRQLGSGQTWKQLGKIKADGNGGQSYASKPFYITNLETNRDYVLSVVASSSAGRFRSLNATVNFSFLLTSKYLCIYPTLSVFL